MTLDAIDINGCRIAYRLDGPREPPVVMLSNSLSSNLSMWNGRIAALGARCRVPRYDQRGHGRSDAPAGHP